MKQNKSNVEIKSNTKLDQFWHKNFKSPNSEKKTKSSSGGQSPVSFWTFVSLIQTCLDLPFSKNVDLWVYLRAAPNPLYKNGASKQLPIEQKRLSEVKCRLHFLILSVKTTNAINFKPQNINLLPRWANSFFSSNQVCPITNGPLVQWEKPCTYNVECNGSSLHNSIIEVSFIYSLIIN